MDIKEIFESVNDQYLEFESVENKRSTRPDIHAFLLLSELDPDGKGDMIQSAWHDAVSLSFDEDLIENLTQEQVIELTRCGVRYEDGYLCMFV